MTNQNEKPPTNQYIDKKRKNVDTSSNNNGSGKAIKHEDMLDLSLWSPNHSATPELQHTATTTAATPTQSQWPELSLSPLPSSLEQAISTVPPPNHSSPPSSPREREGEGGSSESDNDDNDNETIPYEWATDRPATLHTLDHLLSNLQIEKIKGEVKCKRCECEYEMELDLRDNFSQLEVFIWENKDEMYERAPEVWKNPTLPRCRYCHQDNSAKPVIGRSKKAINWLFLLLGQLLGCCTLDQLKFFCQHTKNHRTGAKDRLLYLVYLTLCKQLRPNDPNFDR